MNKVNLDKNLELKDKKSDSNIAASILNDIEFSSELSMSYMEYAMSVILSRAIPDIRDGLKVVQRRILYSMYESNNTYDNRFVKCARIIGNVSGKYHPHGETSIYDALVRLAQPFSLYVPLIQSQGNFGSVDGDGPAAQRYTEARLSKASSLLIDNVHTSLLTLRKNYDASLLEPVFLPCKYPNILINGNNGIAVGFTSCIPSHRPKEIFEILKYMLNSPNYQSVCFDDIKHLIKGPDFSNYCLIDSYNFDNLYRTGRGTIVTTSDVVYDEEKHEIFIYGLAYFVKKMKLIKSIVDCIKEKILNGIVDVIDESSGENYKIHILLESGVNGKVVVRRLLKYTLCSNSIGCVFRFIVNNKPTVVPLVNILKHFIDERLKIIMSKLRLEILNKISSIEKIIALFIASKTESILNVIKEVINSDDVVLVREKLMDMTFDISELHHLLPKNMQKLDVFNFRLTALQVEYLLNTQIIKLNKQKTKDLEVIIKDYSEKIILNEQILNDEIKLKQIILDDLDGILKYIDRDRCCKIILMDKNIRLEDMEPEKDIVLLLDTNQKITYHVIGGIKVQKRGGKGRIAFESSGTLSIVSTTTHDDILLFTAKGYGYKISVFDIYYRNKTLLEIVSLRAGDKFISIKSMMSDKQYDNVLILTSCGLIKKHGTHDFKTFNKLGKRICIIGNNDKIIKIVFVNSKNYCVLFSSDGRFICLYTNTLREFVSRNTKGIKGMKLKDGDNLKDAVGISTDEIDSSILIIDAYGNAKKLPSSMFLNKVSKRNSIGISCINKKYGFLAACVKIVNHNCRIIIATKSGKVMIINFDEIPEAKRLNKGLKLVNLNKNDHVVFVDLV